MAQNIIFNKKTYKDVPAVEFTTTTGGTASFIDTSEGTATAGDIAKDKIAFVGGEKIVGTLVNSGSGGSPQLNYLFGESDPNNIYYKNAGLEINLSSILPDKAHNVFARIELLPSDSVDSIIITLFLEGLNKDGTCGNYLADPNNFLGLESFDSTVIGYCECSIFQQNTYLKIDYDIADPIISSVNFLKPKILFLPMLTLENSAMIEEDVTNYYNQSVFNYSIWYI